MTKTILIHDSEAAFYAAELRRSVPGPDYIAAPDLDKAMADAPRAEVLIGLAPKLPPALIAAMTRLEWIQALTTGIDNLDPPEGVAITNCHGIHGPQMSELAVLLMLSGLRRFPQMLAAQRRAEWNRQPQPLLWGKTACIVGLGAIAEHLAGLLAAFGMNVTGVSSGRSAAPGFARIYPREALPVAASEADFLILLTAYGPATHHIVDAQVIAAMKPSAHLINLSRGGCLDEAALSEALRQDRIAGAALDVFSQEPLPPTSPLWHMPGLTITPHIGGFSDNYPSQALPIIARNLADYLAGGIGALQERLDR